MYVHNIMHYINYVTDKVVKVYYLYLIKAVCGRISWSFLPQKDHFLIIGLFYKKLLNFQVIIMFFLNNLIYLLET